jgi:hypothetical protein
MRTCDLFFPCLMQEVGCGKTWYSSKQKSRQLKLPKRNRQRVLKLFKKRNKPLSQRNTWNIKTKLIHTWSHCMTCPPASHLKFLLILLAYNSCIRVYTVIFTYVFKIYLSWVYPLHGSRSFSSPHSQNNFNRFHSFIFIYGIKLHPPYIPSFNLSLCWPPSLWYPPPEKIYFPLLLFLF